MAQTKELYEEVIDEIGTQTLARFGLNIFSLRTYEAYGASVTMTNDTARAYNQHKNNDKYFGQTFEELDIGIQNIKDSLLNSGTKTYTTDTLADIKKTQEILRDGKNLESLNPKDRAKVEHILANYGDEVKSMDFTRFPLKEFAHKNHNTTDTITFDSKGNVVKTSQLKVIKNTNDLLKDRYLTGDLAVDELKVPFEDYKKHKEKLEKMIAEGKDSNDPKVIEKAEKAKIALEKLNANNVCNRLMCENPRITAVTTQTIVAGGHIVQAGASDAIVVALSTLANGVIWEVKDMYASRTIDSETSVLERIKRLLHKVIESFKSTFKRGAGFGTIDVIMGIVGQIFTSVASSLKFLWSNIRASAKSIYNGIYDYASGKITNMRKLLSTILKSLFSAAWVVPVIALEQKLALMLPFGSLLAPVFAIVIGAFAVVVTCRSIDMTLDSIFMAFAERDKAKLRADEIAELINEKLPKLIANQKELESIIAQTHKQRLLDFDASFSDYQKAVACAQNEEMTRALSAINALWGKELHTTRESIKATLQDPNHTGILQW